MGGPVVLDHIGVVDRDVGGPPLEVVDGIAAVTHHLHDQDVGLGHALGRCIDEPLLNTLPRLHVLGPSPVVEGDDVELLAAPFPLAQLLLRFLAALRALERPVVLGPEPVLQAVGPLPSPQPQRQDHQDHHCHADGDERHCHAVHCRYPLVERVGTYPRSRGEDLGLWEPTQMALGYTASA